MGTSALNEKKYSNSDLIFFGDASTDYYAAEKCGIDFVAINSFESFPNAIYSFKNFKELETKGKFNENSINEITGEKNTFFNLGPENNWKKILKKESIDKIEKEFNKEMKELGYL